MQHELADIAIVGVGQSDFRALYAPTDRPRDAFGLAAAALREAIEDCGIDKDEIDGLLSCRVPYDRLATVTGLSSPRFVHDLEGTGRMSGIALQEAAALISSGVADVVACVYGNNGRSAKVKYGGEGAGPTTAYDEMYGMTSPGAYVGMMYQRYRGMYGAGEDALAPLAINNRRHAALNPVAVLQKEFTREEYLSSRYIAEPLRLLDYCLINDGAVAFIVTSMDRARSLRKAPVRVAGTAGLGHIGNYYTAEDFFYSACQDVASRLYEQTGIAPEEVDCLQIYDNFTPTILFTLEGFNHAPQGEAWRWVDEEKIRHDGPRPLNTAGGHTSESYMQGWAHHVEAVRQLRGEAGGRQVPGCSTVQYMCASPIVTSHILTNDEAVTR
ncbi:MULTISPECIES: thiolase family protein [Actinomadura]|uniref:Thiolase family protein n=1 Tax=Actinomadura litoris TaxID=2678616 RepID=A0A7K1KSC8_9ACTN|nr:MULTISPECIES: thiolase family protein [Actinomadura]MBT2208073.1 thiolase family protein [Actinomadura sp. NEAU-AAG7]MUN35084.1 thiolase family protein [Actinomadura litoris]